MRETISKTGQKQKEKRNVKIVRGKGKMENSNLDITKKEEGITLVAFGISTKCLQFI